MLTSKSWLEICKLIPNSFLLFGLLEGAFVPVWLGLPEDRGLC